VRVLKSLLGVDPLLNVPAEGDFAPSMGGRSLQSIMPHLPKPWRPNLREDPHVVVEAINHLWSVGHRGYAFNLLEDYVQQYQFSLNQPVRAVLSVCTQVEDAAAE